MTMPTLPAVDACDDEWHAFSAQRCDELIPYLAEFILDRFNYKARYVQQRLWRSFGTVSAFTRQYDLYFRMFLKPQEFWPRECLVLARIGFKQQRVGHGRALVELLVDLAPKFGYRYLAVECANANASAFAERLGFTPYENRRHWIGSVTAIQKALDRQTG